MGFQKEDVVFLNQLAGSLEEASIKLEKFYNRKDVENFNRTKKFILNIQNKIAEVLG